MRAGTQATAVRRERRRDARARDGTSVSGDEILVAVGRRTLTGRPRARDVGAGARAPDRGRRHDARPGHDWLYAIGDVNGRALLTHMGKYQGRVAADHILGREVQLRSDGALSPRVTFTDPQVAAVGHTAASAREAGLDVRAVDVPTGANAGGSFYGRDAPGTARIVVDEDRRVIVGATFTGPDIAEFAPRRDDRRDRRGPLDASGTRSRASRRAASCG